MYTSAYTHELDSTHTSAATHEAMKYVLPILLSSFPFDRCSRYVSERNITKHDSSPSKDFFFGCLDKIQKQEKKLQTDLVYMFGYIYNKSDQIFPPSLLHNP
jgi:hypothetical protein